MKKSITTFPLQALRIKIFKKLMVSLVYVPMFCAFAYLFSGFFFLIVEKFPKVDDTRTDILSSVGIRSRIRIAGFLGLPGPNPLVRGIGPDPDPSLFS